MQTSRLLGRSLVKLPRDRSLPRLMFLSITPIGRMSLSHIRFEILIAILPVGMTSIWNRQNHSWAALSGDNFPSLVREAPLSKFERSIDWRAPSIYDNEDILRTAITGVHRLANAQIPRYTSNLNPEFGDCSGGHTRNSHADVLSVINGANNLNNGLDLVDTGHNALDKYISPEELQIYRLKIQEEISKKLSIGKSTFLHTYDRPFCVQNHREWSRIAIDTSGPHNPAAVQTNTSASYHIQQNRPLPTEGSEISGDTDRSVTFPRRKNG